MIDTVISDHICYSYLNPWHSPVFEQQFVSTDH